MFSSPAFAQAAGDAAGAPDGMMAALVQFAPLVFIFVIFYFLLIRPQQQQRKRHLAMIEALKRGDTVVTAGGLIGKVKSVSDDEARLELSPNVEVRVIRSTITEVRAKSDPAPANDTKKTEA
ncbi:MAG: preprotein translocase subunit YajC [Hyphomonadaceae bacterium]